jgi:hypothetical protein
MIVTEISCYYFRPRLHNERFILQTRPLSNTNANKQEILNQHKHKNPHIHMRQSYSVTVSRLDQLLCLLWQA